jgi:hypothetical protein
MSSTEDIYAAAAMGFLLGLFAFGVGLIRVRAWKRTGPGRSRSDSRVAQDRYSAPPTVQPRVDRRQAFMGGVAVLDRIGDLVGLLLILAMLLYGAWVAPRLRLAIAVAALTVGLCCLVWRAVRRPG